MENLLLKGIRTKIRNSFVVVQKRAYAVPDKASMLVLKPAGTPSVGIVYKGSMPKTEKGSSKTLNTHNFDIYIFQTIWQEEAVCLGEFEKKGLLELNENLKEMLKDFKEYQGVDVINTSIKDSYGTEAYPDFSRKGFSASIGFRLEIKEYS